MYWPILLSAKSDHPELDFKLIDQDGLLDLLSFRFKDDPIPALLKAGVGYAAAKKWIHILRVAPHSQHPKIVKYRKIVDPYVCFDPLSKVELSRYSIAFFELSDEVELHNLCSQEGYEVEDLGFRDFPIEQKLHPEEEYYLVRLFRDKFDQYWWAFARLRGLLTQPRKYAESVLHIDEGPGNAFYLSCFSSLFELPVFLRERTPLRADHKVAKHLKNIYVSRNFELNLDEKVTPEEKRFADLIQKYGLAELPFDEAFASLQEMLASQYVEEERTDRGILVQSDFTIFPDRMVWIFDFQDGRFFKTYSDNNVLTDAELASEGLNTSYVLTTIDHRNKLNYLLYSRVVHFTRVEQHLQDKIYDSPILDEFIALNPKWGKIDRRILSDVSRHTIAAANISVRQQLELNNAKNINKAFPNPYSHEFNGLLSYCVNPKKTWSISAVKKYATCPFACYMDSLLPQTDSDKTAILIGGLFHKVFESIYREGFDFESAFASGIEAYKQEAAKMGQKITAKDEVFFDVFRRVFDVLLPQIQDFCAVSKISEDASEKRVYWTLSDGKRDYPFTGIIDKILYYGEPGTNGYYFILDYKTGAETFDVRDVPYGGSIQLPMYSFALEKQDGNQVVQGYKFLGFGIQNILFSDSVGACSSDGVYSYRDLLSNLKFGDVTMNYLDGWGLMDSTGVGQDRKSGEFTIKGGKFVGKGSMFASPEDGHFKYPIGPYYESWTLEQVWKAAEKVCIAAVKEIKKGNFPIAPSSRPFYKNWSPRASACKYCTYKDICYRKQALDHRNKFALDPSVFNPNAGKELEAVGDDNKGKEE